MASEKLLFGMLKKMGKFSNLNFKTCYISYVNVYITLHFSSFTITYNIVKKK